MTNATVYMPDGKGGTKPAPFVLDEDDAILFLRLDKTKVEDKGATLAYYRKNGKLSGRIMGRSVVYTLAELINFVETGAAQTA